MNFRGGVQQVAAGLSPGRVVGRLLEAISKRVQYSGNLVLKREAVQ